MGAPKIPEPRFSPSRGPEIASRVGIPLGIAVAVCFCTGLLSHWIQHPPDWFVWPPHPVWLYRVTQGLHVVTGVVAIPLLLVKLWAVYPRLFAKPLVGSIARIAERASIAVLMGAIIFQLATGLINIAQFYPWKFFFTTTHYAMAWVALGALAVHLGVKLPAIRDGLSRPLRPRQTGIDPDIASPTRISRRAILVAAALGGIAAALSMAGQTVPALRRISVLAPRSGEGPQGVPVNRSAEQAGVAPVATDPRYTLIVTAGPVERRFTRAELLALPQTTAELPIACVEGWSASATWTGVRLRDLLAELDTSPDTDVRFVSLERTGIYGVSVLPAPHVRAADTLIALALNGETLDLDHGYPCRLIAPNRPGVLQTKWLERIEVLET